MLMPQGARTAGLRRRRVALALIAITVIVMIMIAAAIMLPPALAGAAVTSVTPTVTPWGGRRGVMPGGAAPLFPYWLASLPVIAALIALIAWHTRRSSRS